MGYDTTFQGTVAVVPPLNVHEIAYLRRFAGSRRMDRDLGPYYCGDNDFGREPDADIRNHNRPGPDQPGLWCKWVPSDDGSRIAWSGAEKFYDAEKWMAYLIRTFLMPGAVLAAEMVLPAAGRYYAPEFEHFTFDHVLNGVIDAQGEEDEDVWQIAVADNLVRVRSNGEESGPVTDTAPMPMPETSMIQVQMVLVGGPHNGEIHQVPLDALRAGLTFADGSCYAPDRNTAPGSDVTPDGLILRFQGV
jgi:hypothetical protein